MSCCIDRVRGECLHRGREDGAARTKAKQNGAVGINVEKAERERGR